MFGGIELFSLKKATFQGEGELYFLESTLNLVVEERDVFCPLHEHYGLVSSSCK